MKSVGFRLTFWHTMAVAATVTTLFVLGGVFLSRNLYEGVDSLLAAERNEIESRLRARPSKVLSEAYFDKQIQDEIDADGELFFTQIYDSDGALLFQSSNLEGGMALPEAPEGRPLNLTIGKLGEMRVGEFGAGKMMLRIATPVHRVASILRAYRRACLVALAGVLVLSILIGFGLSRLALRPIRLIEKTANRIGSRNLSERIPVPEVEDEISKLAGLLNKMFDRLEQSFEQIRRFTEDASHELKTPLSLVRLHAEKLLMKGNSTVSEEETLQDLTEEISQLENIIEDLLVLSMAEIGTLSLNLETLGTHEFIQDFTPDARALAASEGVVFKVEKNEEGCARFDPSWIRQVLFNLVSNAFHASSNGKTITLRSGFLDGVWKVSVEDEGAGLSDDQLEKIFERFVKFNASDKEHDKRRNGTGLGLAISRGIVQLHKGRIAAGRAAKGSGLRVEFEIPVEEIEN